MPSLEVEYLPPLLSGVCDCCGGRTVTLHRRVRKDGLPHAIATITFSETHLDDPARAIIGLGPFGSGKEATECFAFAIALRPEGIMVVDAADSDWPVAEVLGRKLDRESALNHPFKSELYDVVDQFYEEDEALEAHFCRVVEAES